MEILSITLEPRGFLPTYWLVIGALGILLLAIVCGMTNRKRLTDQVLTITIVGLVAVILSVSFALQARYEDFGSRLTVGLEQLNLTNIDVDQEEKTFTASREGLYVSGRYTDVGDDKVYIEFDVPD